jgi:recombinational DNA repair protein (RecF pathway)
LSCRDRYGISTFKVMTVTTCSICGRTDALCYFVDKQQTIDPTLYDMDHVQFTRASGDATCRQCGRTYREHPLDRRPEAMAYNGEPFLRVLCDGILVHL